MFHYERPLSNVAIICLQYTIKQADAEWSRQVSRDYKFLESVQLLANKWVVMATRRDGRLANDFITTLKNVGTAMGMVVQDPVM